MPKLDASEPYNWPRALAEASDETVALGLWNFPPEARLAVLSERRRRNILQCDPEPVGDPEYS